MSRSSNNSMKITAKTNLGKIIGIYIENLTQIYKSDPSRRNRLLLIIIPFSLLAVLLFTMPHSILRLQYCVVGALPLHPDLKIVEVGPEYIGTDGVTRKDSLAQIIKRLHAAGAQTIALDYIVQERDRGFTDFRQTTWELEGAVLPQNRERRVNEFFFWSNFEFVVKEPVPPSIEKYVWKGYSNLDKGITWEMMLMSHINKVGTAPPVPSFALAILGAKVMPDRMNAPNELSKWDPALEVANLHNIDRNDLLQRQPIHFFNLKDRMAVTKAQDIGRVPDRFKGKVVLVGGNERIPGDGVDVYRSPFGKVNAVLIHAAIVNNLLHGHYLSRIPTWLSHLLIGLCFSLGIGVMRTFNRQVEEKIRALKKYKWSICTLSIIAIFYCFCAALLLKQGVFIPLQEVLIAMLLGGIIGLIWADGMHNAKTIDPNLGLNMDLPNEEE